MESTLKIKLDGTEELIKAIGYLRSDVRRLSDEVRSLDTSFATLAPLLENRIDEMSAPAEEETPPTEDAAPETASEAQPEAVAPPKATEQPQSNPEAAQPQKNALPQEFTEIRRRLTAYVRAGYSSDIKDIIAKYGAIRLSELNPEAYGQVLKEVEAIANG